MLTKELSNWILLQGATVSQSSLLPLVQAGRSGVVEDTPNVVFGHRKIHFWSDGSAVRIFFNEDNVSTALLLFVKFQELIVRHNIPREINANRTHHLRS